MCIRDRDKDFQEVRDPGNCVTDMAPLFDDKTVLCSNKMLLFSNILLLLSNKME